METPKVLMPSLAESQILTEEIMTYIEAGTCSSGCKKACQHGNMNPSAEKKPPYLLPLYDIGPFK